MYKDTSTSHLKFVLFAIKVYFKFLPLNSYTLYVDYICIDYYDLLSRLFSVN